MSEHSTRQIGISTSSSSTDPRREPGARPRGATEPAEGAPSAAERTTKEDLPRDRRLLVVEDEPSSRRGLQELLTAWGYDVVAAGDGREALERAAERTPDQIGRAHV